MKKLSVLIGCCIFYLALSCASKKDVSKCELEPQAGPCRAAITKYYFDKNEQKCKEFLWGGCKGVVPFDTLEECQKCK